MNRARAERRGRRAETIAAWWLRCHGWRILDARVKTPRGEVDLIAKRGSMIAFVEVKARVSEAELGEAIAPHRLARVAAAAEALYARYAKRGEDMRIDVIWVAPRQWPRHLVNLWHG